MAGIIQRTRQRVGSWIAGGKSGGSRTLQSRVVSFSDAFYAFAQRSGSTLKYTEEDVAYAASVSVYAWACIEQRCRAISMFPVRAYHAVTGEEIKQSTFHNTMDWAYRQYDQDLIWQMEMSLAIWGENYEEKLLDEDDKPGGLRWLNPLAIEPYIESGVVHYYEYINKNGRIVTFHPEEIVYRKYAAAQDDERGWSPMYRALRSVDIDELSARFILSFYKNDATPGGVLAAKQGYEIDEQVEERIKAQWTEQLKGADKAFATIMLPFPLEYTPFSSGPPDWQDRLEEGTRRKICAALNVPMSMVDAAGVSDPLSAGSTMDAKQAGFYETWAIPEADDITQHYSIKVIPWLDPQIRIALDTSEMKARLKQTNMYDEMIDRRFKGGRMTLNEARKAVGDKEINGGDVLRWDTTAVAVPVGQIGQINELTRPQMPTIGFTPMGGGSAGQMPALGGGMQTPQLPAPSGRHIKASDGPPEATAILTFRDVAPLLHIQDFYRANLPAELGIRWTNPDSLHITLVHAPLVDAADLNKIYAELAGGFDPLRVRVKEIGVFSKPETDVLVVFIEPSEDLVGLQRWLYDLFTHSGIQLSAYSQPDQYKPHVTLAYLPPGTYTALDSAFFNDMDVVATNLLFTRPDYKPVYQAHVRSRTPTEIARLSVDTMLAELEAWKKFEINRLGKKSARAFVPQYIPSHIAGDISAELTQAREQAHPALIRAVFDAAHLVITDQGMKLADVLTAYKASNVDEDLMAELLERVAGIEGLEGMLTQLDQIDEAEDDELD